jgi:crotonobetaine/carnitine-CoA ligase
MGDQIRRRGVNIAAADIEATALRFGGIQEAAAFAIPSDLGESEAVLAVVAADDATGFTVEGLAQYLREQLPREMVPRYLEVRSSFPVTSTYKVPKIELRSRWLDGVVPSGAIDIAIEGAGR